MSLKSFHVIFIVASISLMTFLTVWAWRMGQVGQPQIGLMMCGSAGFAAALGYLGWFLKRYRYL